MVRRRRRAKSRRAKRGQYTSTRTGETYTYRSGWEAQYMAYLDSESTIAIWTYESIEIPYVSAPRSGRVRRYIPDFLIERVDGSRAVIEIKPASKVDRPTNVKKFFAARAWCVEREIEFVVITEIDLKALGLL